MKLPHCDREQEVVDALRSGRWASEWGVEIRQHAAVCAVCAEVALVAQEFQREAELARAELQQPGAGLPSAGLVWWKAQLAARRAAEQRAAEPIILVERAAYALGALAALGLGVWQWPRLAAWLHADRDYRAPASLRGDARLFFQRRVAPSPRAGLDWPDARLSAGRRRRRLSRLDGFRCLCGLARGLKLGDDGAGAILVRISHAGFGRAGFSP